MAKQQQPKEQPKQQPQQQPKQQQPTKKPKPRSPVIKRITMEYFHKFNPHPSRKSWVKEAIEMAAKEPIMLKNLNRGQIMALINQIDKHNMTTDFKIAYKYDVKAGIVLLAPKKLIAQREGRNEHHPSTLEA